MLIWKHSIQKWLASTHTVANDLPVFLEWITVKLTYMLQCLIWPIFRCELLSFPLRKRIALYNYDCICIWNPQIFHMLVFRKPLPVYGGIWSLNLCYRVQSWLREKLQDNNIVSDFQQENMLARNNYLWFFLISLILETNVCSTSSCRSTHWKVTSATTPRPPRPQRAK